MPGITSVGQTCQCELGKLQNGLRSEETLSLAKLDVRYGCSTHPSGDTSLSHGEH